MRLIAWILISACTTATVYNAVPEQTNAQPTVTASGLRINPAQVAGLRVLAMERTMMARHGIAYGDTVLVRGAGAYDGEWVVEDTMGARYAGQDKIDFLVPENVKLGRWEGVEVYVKRNIHAMDKWPWEAPTSQVGPGGGRK